MFRIGSTDMWSQGALAARPISLGQETCPIGGTCGEGVDRAQAAKYADLLATTISENPGCFEGEDLEVAYATESRLRTFSRSFPEMNFGKVAANLKLSDDENRVIQAASGCRKVVMVKPGPEPVSKPAQRVEPGKIQTFGSQPEAQVQAATAAPSQEKSNILPMAIGAAAGLALIYALVR